MGEGFAGFTVRGKKNMFFFFNLFFVFDGLDFYFFNFFNFFNVIIYYLNDIIVLFVVF